jgi:hypothetical protein
MKIVIPKALACNPAISRVRVNTIDLLMGRVPAPKAGEPLYNALKVIIRSSGCNSASIRVYQILMLLVI